VYRVDALAHVILPTFADPKDEVKSGWGLDHVWPFLLRHCFRHSPAGRQLCQQPPRQQGAGGQAGGGGQSGCHGELLLAIIDCMAVVHTKPPSVQKGANAPGSFYDVWKINPEQELRDCLQRYVCAAQCAVLIVG
jgi:hypothetical protein